MPLRTSGRAVGEAGEVKLFGLVLGKFEQYGLQVADVPADAGGVQRVAVAISSACCSSSKVSPNSRSASSRSDWLDLT
jgi:hypothetical protein